MSPVALADSQPQQQQQQQTQSVPVTIIDVPVKEKSSSSSTEVTSNQDADKIHHHANGTDIASASTPLMNGHNHHHNSSTSTNTLSNHTYTSFDNADQLGKPLEGDELRAALLKQLEFYFSRENLSNDAYLVSNMRNDLYVSIDVVAGFQKVKALTENVQLIVDVLRTSRQVTVDAAGKMVKPNITMLRNTIMLRDIPSDVPEEEIRSIFSTDCAPIKTLRSDIGDTWFVTFESEDEAVSTHFVIRSRTFRSKQVQACIKSENLLKSSFAPRDRYNASAAAATSNAGFSNMNGDMAMNGGGDYGYYVGPGAVPFIPGRPGQWGYQNMMAANVANQSGYPQFMDTTPNVQTMPMTSQAQNTNGPTPAGGNNSSNNNNTRSNNNGERRGKGNRNNQTSSTSATQNTTVTSSASTSQSHTVPSSSRNNNKQNRSDVQGDQPSGKVVLPTPTYSQGSLPPAFVPSGANVQQQPQQQQQQQQRQHGGGGGRRGGNHPQQHGSQGPIAGSQSPKQLPLPGAVPVVLPLPSQMQKSSVPLLQPQQGKLGSSTHVQSVPLPAGANSSGQAQQQQQQQQRYNQPKRKGHSGAPSSSSNGQGVAAVTSATIAGTPSAVQTGGAVSAAPAPAPGLDAFPPLPNAVPNAERPSTTSSPAAAANPTPVKSYSTVANTEPPKPVEPLAKSETKRETSSSGTTGAVASSTSLPPPTTGAGASPSNTSTATSPNAGAVSKDGFTKANHSKKQFAGGRPQRNHHNGGGSDHANGQGGNSQFHYRPGNNERRGGSADRGGERHERSGHHTGGSSRHHHQNQQQNHNQTTQEATSSTTETDLSNTSTTSNSSTTNAVTTPQPMSYAQMLKKPVEKSPSPTNVPLRSTSAEGTTTTAVQPSSVITETANGDTSSSGSPSSTPVLDNKSTASTPVNNDQSNIAAVTEKVEGTN